MTESVVTDDDFSDMLAQLREFIREEVIPRETQIADENRIPDELREMTKQLGLFGYAIDQEWGGIGLNQVQQAELAMELGYASLAFRSMFGTNNGIAGQVITGFGTTAQKERWLEGIASGEVVASFALTESGAGSNPASIRTRATATDQGWTITGSKRFITNAPDAHLFITFAKVLNSTTGKDGVEVFLIPAESAGVSVGPPDKKMGQAGALTADVNFDDVDVAEEALVGGVLGIGYKAALTSLSKGRITIAALAVGQAQRALDESLEFATTAKQGDSLIGDFQLVQAMLADQQVGVAAGRNLVLGTARAYLDGSDTRVGPSVAKLFCTEMAAKVVDSAVQVHGGSGYMRDYPVERIYRDVRLLRLYEGTSEIQRLIIGSNLVKNKLSGR
ncbi:acyl-CoA dehydrogenase family protein [Microbacterium profundi]